MATYTDNFTGTPNQALESHNATWVSKNGASAMIIYGLDPTQVITNTSQGHGYYWNNTFATAHYAQVVWKAEGATNEYIGPAVRVQSGSNQYYYCLANSGDAVYNGYNNAGSFGDWDAGQAAIAANNTVRLEIDATTTTTIYYKVNGSTVQTYTGNTELTGGFGGITGYNAGCRADDWEGGDVAGGPGDLSSAFGEGLLGRSTF